MPSPAYMQVQGEKQGKIEGSCDIKGREGTILVQSPPAGETEPEFESVSLLVSRGRWGADYVMPDLIGRKAEGVLAVLSQAGLKVADVRYRSYPGVSPGIVLRQLPPAGYRVGSQTTVTLDVSRAAPTVPALTPEPTAALP